LAISRKQLKAIGEILNPTIAAPEKNTLYYYQNPDGTVMSSNHHMPVKKPLHNDGDLPAIIKSNGTQEWYKHGRRHRDGDLPAIIKSNGSQEWYKYGEKHRDGDKPAVVRADGTQEWYEYDRHHRIGGPARIDADGTEEWFMRGLPHREDGPAVVWGKSSRFKYYGRTYKLNAFLLLGHLTIDEQILLKLKYG
jgi:predicted lipoprotein with Yx(FWY)xxD motif